jgi:hypothetical protein
VLSAELATGPLQVELIIDDNGTGLFRSSVGLFIRSCSGTPNSPSAW